MLNLTPEQKTLLKWMKTGRTFRVYSGYGSVENSIIPASRLPIRVFPKTVRKLYQAGLITFTPTDSFGQRWDKFSLTPAGLEAICRTA
ncbi:hypothetical protein [uncultured Vibrio sp.]|uniref:hypothetical protein n=1 Tax=uncultured Vibrio sp. TaxID=114054 RepID=UPI00091C5F35|nr:hypothetical protein [uncultured Vibrio sp.]OIQ24886.1 MAG: hypothetical protein BM561_08345 [Vibrio sp. MedPE-SWchi]